MAIFLGIFAVIWIMLPLIGRALPSNTSTALSLGIVVMFLSVLQGYANDIHSTVTKLDSSKYDVKTFSDQVSANSALIAWIRSHSVSEAKLIEYDGDSIKPVIFTLLQNGVHVHLLLQHPDFACSVFQRNRVLHQIAVREREFSEYAI